jgi:hypothetical protein
MDVPIAARWVAGVFGVLLLIYVWRSVIGTLLIPRLSRDRLSRLLDRVVISVYALLTRYVAEYRRRDRILVSQPAVILFGQIVIWLVLSVTGFILLLWPLTDSSIGVAFRDAGSSVFTLGFSEPNGAVPAGVTFLAADTGLLIVSLQIAYLPTLYAAFHRRETEVTLLNGWGGVPAWGPELLARTHYGPGSDASGIGTLLPDMYRRWERWAADVAESHTTHRTLVWFRSPRPTTSWVTSLLAVLDSAALMLTLSPEQAPIVPARLCLRGGRECLLAVAQALGLSEEAETEPETISLSYEDFLGAAHWMERVEFPISREPTEAWPDFIKWRATYERAAYAIAERIDAVPALWSGPRRHPTMPIPPSRPHLSRPPSRPSDTAGPNATDRSSNPVITHRTYGDNPPAGGPAR